MVVVDNLGDGCMQYCISSEEDLKHKGTVPLETNRFMLRKFQLSDSHDVYENWSSDYDSARYNAWNVHENEAVTKSYIFEWVENYKRLNYYNWAVWDKENDEVIGSISATNIKNKKKYCEIGYTVAKKRWNEGIATEVLVKVLDFLTSEVGFVTIRAMHDVRNVSSGRVMEKAGMVFIKNKIQIFLSGHNYLMKCRVYEYRNSSTIIFK